jgi:hypothetical protein
VYKYQIIRQTEISQQAAKGYYEIEGVYFPHQPNTLVHIKDLQHFDDGIIQPNIELIFLADEPYGLPTQNR